MKKFRVLRGKDGFTLIEIIVVLVILAIMAAALIPTMMGYVGDTKKKSHLATARAYYTAAQAVAVEEFALNDTIWGYNFDSASASPYADRWIELTADLPGAGSRTSMPQCTVLVENEGTSTARIKHVQFTYDTGKFVRLNVSDTNSEIIIDYGN